MSTFLQFLQKIKINFYKFVLMYILCLKDKAVFVFYLVSY